MRAGCGEAVDQPGSINARILAVGPAVLRSGCAGRGREKVGICVLCPAGVSRTGGSNRISPQGPTDCSNARRFELRDGIVIRSHCQDLDLGAVGRMTCLITEQPIVTVLPRWPPSLSVLEIKYASTDPCLDAEDRKRKPDPLLVLVSRTVRSKETADAERIHVWLHRNRSCEA